MLIAHLALAQANKVLAYASNSSGGLIGVFFAVWAAFEEWP
jgi:hypothetical protein